MTTESEARGNEGKSPAMSASTGVCFTPDGGHYDQIRKSFHTGWEDRPRVE